MGIYTIDRVKRLCQEFHLPMIFRDMRGHFWVPGVSKLSSPWDFHDILDQIERGINNKTHSTVENYRFVPGTQRSPSLARVDNYVGARLARLEEQVFGGKYLASLPMCPERHGAEDELDGCGIGVQAGAFSFWLGEMG